MVTISPSAADRISDSICRPEIRRAGAPGERTSVVAVLLFCCDMDAPTYCRSMFLRMT
jgi:hypothetical protein